MSNIIKAALISFLKYIIVQMIVYCERVQMQLYNNPRTNQPYEYILYMLLYAGCNPTQI